MRHQNEKGTVYCKSVAAEPEDGFQKFNRGPHACLEMYGHATVSIKFPGGTATLSLLPKSCTDNAPMCIDCKVNYESAPKDEEGRPLMKTLAFNGGRDAFRGEATLITILNPELY